MDPLKVKKKPEKIIQDALEKFLLLKGWFTINTHGNMYQSGFPDMYCCHRRYGARWVEVKNPLKYSFTPAQLDVFPQFSAQGVGIWILTAATEEQYNLLFKSANWHTFIKF